MELEENKIIKKEPRKNKTPVNAVKTIKPCEPNHANVVI
jgi:hypothetical protein